MKYKIEEIVKAAEIVARFNDPYIPANEKLAIVAEAMKAERHFLLKTRAFYRVCRYIFRMEVTMRDAAEAARRFEAAETIERIGDWWDTPNLNKLF